MTGPTNPDLDSIRRILFGADLARIEQSLGEAREQAAARSSDVEQRQGAALQSLEKRLEQRLEELTNKVTTQLEDLSRRQQAHAERATQLLDQVMAELSRRTDALQAETRSGLEEMRSRTSELERRKLNVADFGSALGSLGQKFTGSGDSETK